MLAAWREAFGLFQVAQKVLCEGRPVKDMHITEPHMAPCPVQPHSVHCFHLFATVPFVQVHEVALFECDFALCAEHNHRSNLPYLILLGLHEFSNFGTLWILEFRIS